MNTIQKNYKDFFNEIEIESFNLITRKLTKTERENNIRYLNWSYFGYLINSFTLKTEDANIGTSQIIKGLSLHEDSFERKQILLFNSYYYLENFEETLPNPFLFKEGVIIDSSKLFEQKNKTKEQLEAWQEIKRSFENDTPLKVTLKRKSKSGFNLHYKGLKGFLPIHHINEKSLRNYGLENCDITTNVSCISYDTTFNYFVVKQFDLNDENYLLLNNIETSISKGQIVDGRIKAIQRYGLFIVTESGEGLLHVSNIFDFFWDFNDIYEYFHEGQEIKVYVKEIEDGNKISFSLKMLKNIENDYYEDFVKKTVEESSEEDALLEVKRHLSSHIDIIQNEKALCIEQLALFQNDIRKKLNSFRLAKQFYSNTNHARSFLINIYTEYFEILLKLKSCVDNRKIQDFNTIREQAFAVEKRINSKTIETFPESKKLILFLRIIQVFNDDSLEVIDELYDYIIEYSKIKKTQSLRTISKITLSNNLMISEINDNDDFNIKNLNLIYQYLANGILTLTESESDKYSREMREKVAYLKQKIADDESETLEFKASLFKPYPNERRLSLLKKWKEKPQDAKVKKEISKINGDLAKKAIIHEAFKNLCAFANTNGGILLIGVNDDKSIRGIEGEFKEIPGTKKNRDGYGLRFDDLIKSYFGDAFSSLLKREILDFPEGSVFVVEVVPSLNEVFILKDEEGNSTEELYIRNYSSAQCLTGKSLVTFIKNIQIKQLNAPVTKQKYESPTTSLILQDSKQ